MQIANEIKIYVYIIMLMLLPVAKSMAMLGPALDHEEQLFMFLKHWPQNIGLPNDVVFEISKRIRALIIAEALQSGDYSLEREIRGDFRRTVDFSPNSSFIIANNTVIQAQDGVIKYHFPGHKHFFSPDGKLIAISDNDQNKLSIWNFKDETLLKTFQSDAYIAECAFSHDNSFIIISCHKHFLVGQMETASLEKVDNVDFFYSLAISPDDTVIAFSAENNVQLWDIASLTRKSVLGDGDYYGNCAMVFSSDGKELLVKQRNAIKTWDIEKNEKKRSIKLGPLGGVQQYKHAMAFSSKPRLMARSCWPEYDAKLPTVIEIFSDASGEKLRTLKEIGLRVVGMALSPDGHRLALIINSHSLQIWVLKPLLQKQH